jgi:hypothetical protein
MPTPEISLPDPAPASLRAGNLAVKFALELVAIGAFAYWGATVVGGPGSVLLAIAAPVAAIVLWGRFAAPRSNRRLALRLRIPFELTVFALASLVLIRASSVAAIAFAAIVLGNALLLTLLHQWEA